MGVSTTNPNVLSGMSLGYELAMVVLSSEINEPTKLLIFDEIPPCVDEYAFGGMFYNMRHIKLDK